MTDDKAKDTEALLALLELAHADIDQALGEDGAASAEAFREACSGHLENILLACERAGLDDLYLATDALLAHLANDETEIDTGFSARLLDWCGDARLYAEAPAAVSVEALLAPLPPEARDSLLPVLSAGGGATPDSAAVTKAESRAEVEQINTALPGLPAGDSPAGTTAPEIADDDLLGMLAFELTEVGPELDEVAQRLAAADAGPASASLVEAYREILGRVDSVARELDLQGLAFICGFVARNLELIVDLGGDERGEAIAVLRGWPALVVDHLRHPADDSRCLAVVDYLEAEAWPEPVPYRDQRTLIEGLARSIEISGGFVAEVREIEATADDVALEMSADASPELVDAFFAESPGHAESLSALTAAINRGEAVQRNVEAAQRIAHTLKGSGNLVGARGIANLAHHLEDILEYIARHEIRPPAPLANTMQEASDLLEAMIEALQGLVPPPEEAQRVLQDVLDWANRIDAGDMRAADFGDSEESGDGKAEASGTEARDPDQPERRSDRQAEPAPAADEVVRVPLKLLDNIFRIVSETAITAGQIQERLNRLEDGEKFIRNNDGQMQQLRFELENLVSVRGMAAKHRGAAAGAKDKFDALEMDEYDELYSATHAYIESVADSRELLREFSGEVYELDSLFLEQQRLSKELQQMVMTTRLVPVSTIASRLQRTVRQACRATGKQAELSIYGQELLLDGDVLNKLADPLMHVLRNAVDHGIEDRDTRIAAGKSAAGHIVLRFVQEGNNVAVSCEDDGRGLDFERIRETAIERELIGSGDAPDNEMLARLILRAGFSTSTRVTQVSGRGVGLDVVNNAIQALNGTMKVGDANDGGTLVSLRLPITLLTSHCLLTGVGRDKLYAIPTLSLTQILSPGMGSIENLGNEFRYRLEEDDYPAITLNALVGAPDGQMREALERHSVLLVRAADGVVAVIVERVVTSYDLVVKNMGAFVKSVSGIAGVSMLGNGEVVPVLDLAALLQARSDAGLGGTQLEAAAEIEEAVGLPKVLIVDDSLSVRNSLAQLIRDSGYEAILARDGLEAVNLLRAEAPDIVLTDLEMPRMNGFELIGYIRNTSEWRNMPVVMITSRNMAKHRQKAEAAGVNRFIAKPFGDDEILECIEAELAALV